MITGPAWLIALGLERIANLLPDALALVQASFLRVEFRATLAESLVERAHVLEDDRAAGDMRRRAAGCTAP